MTDSMVYDYEHRLVTPDDAKNILGGELPKDNPHHADDACLIWEPIRLVYDRDGRLLLGTDELRHIAASGIPLDAAVYHEPADREYVTPVVAAPRTETKPEEPVKPEPEPKPKKPEPVPEPEAKRTAEAPRPKPATTSPRKQVIELLRAKYPQATNPVSWAGVPIALAGPDATYGDVERTLKHMDVTAEYEWFRLALKVQRRMKASAVGAALLMHEQAAGGDPARVRAFWGRLLDPADPLTAAAPHADADDLLDFMRREWKDA